MFRFAFVDALYGLILVPLLAWFLWYTARRRRRSLERFGDLDLVRKLSQTVSRRARAVKAVLLVGAVGLLIAALARPQFGTRVETVRRRGKDIIVALDLSRSMLAEDVSPSRLRRSKLDIQRLIQRLEGDRVGLVGFAGQAFTQSPLTTDYGAAMMFLNAMEPDLMPVQGTNLGEAMSLALDAFGDESTEHRIIVVVTDGEDHEGEVEAATARAVEAGVRVYTLGVGSPEGVPIPEVDANGGRRGFKRDADGNVVTTRLEEATLRHVAEATGGRYYRSSPEVNELPALVGELETLGGREIDTREITRFEEQFQIFLGLALLFVFVEAVVPDRRRVKEEWKGRFR